MTQRTRILLFAVLATGIAGLAYLVHARARAALLQAKDQELAAIAELKASRIMAWRTDQLADARVIAADPLLAAAAQGWLAGPASAGHSDALRRRLSSVKDEYGYARVSLADQGGAWLMTVPEAGMKESAGDDPLRQAFASSQVSFVDLHQDGTGKGVHLELVAPLRLAGDSERRPVGFLVLQIDPRRSLDSLLRAWPTASRTAETVLVRREGNEVVFLNELRHAKGAALSQRRPLARADLPASMAVRGTKDVAAAVDCRGARVQAAFQPVPDSPWFLVTKVDREELLAPLAGEARVTALLALALVGLAGLSLLRSPPRASEAPALQRGGARERASLESNLAGVAERLRLQGAALEAAANAVMITDREGSIVWVNEAFARLTGWGLLDCQGKTPRILKSGRHEPKHYEELWSTILAGEAWQHEMINRRKDGTTYIEDQTITPVRDEQGSITHFVAIKIDVSEKRRAEQALWESEARYRTLAEASQDLIFVVDPQGRLAYVNSAAAARLGRSSADLQGRRIEDLFPPHLSAAMNANVQRVASTRQPFYEEREIAFPSAAAWLGTWLVPLTKGTSSSVMGVSRDITERKRAEAALRESEERYRVLAESVSDGILIVEVGAPDQTARISFVNPAAERIFGYSRAELLGRELTLLIPPSLRERHLAGLSRYLETGEKRVPWVNVEQRALHKSGREIPIEISFAELELDTRLHSFVSTVRDISERKLAEDRHAKAEEQLRQSQKLEAIGRLAGGVAHDFNNMLGVITGYGELMRRQVAEDHPARRRLEEVLKAAERAAGLTRQLLAFGRKQVMQTRLLDLNDLVRDMHNMFERVVGEDVEIAVREAAGLGIVRADPTHIEQVLMNLVVNARDAMPGGGRLTLETANIDFDEEYALVHPPATPGRFVMLAVSDTGVGMDAETQRQAFEPFFSTKPVGEGTGLGLSTVYGIVKQSGGYVWVYSEPGRGTTFKVYLPRVEQAAESEIARSPTVAVPRGHETVLLVEDTETLREMIGEALQEQGYTVLSASQGEEALALAAGHERPIDLLLTDVVMPKLGGADLARRIAERQPGIRVLYMSGYAEGAISRLGTLPEGALLLEKPFTNERLVRAVREALQEP